MPGVGRGLMGLLIGLLCGTSLGTMLADPVPAPCVRALNEADKVFDINARMSGYVSEHLEHETNVWTALAEDDRAELLPYTGSMLEFTGNVRALKLETAQSSYIEDRDVCLESELP